MFETKTKERLAVAKNPTQDTLACAASALPLSYDNRTTTSPHIPMYCTSETKMPQSHT